MRLLTAHKILIATFVAFLTFFGVWELRAWQGGGGVQNLVIGAGSWIAAGAFSLYLKTVWGKTPDTF